MVRFDLNGLTRRNTLLALASGVATLVGPLPLLAAPDSGFARWVANFKARAVARGISEKTYDRVMNAVTPDTSVYALQRSQPEFTEQMWQYINRRCSEWRVNTGTRARQTTCRSVQPHRARLRRRSLRAARPVGHGILVRRCDRQPEIYAAGHPGACRARLWRAAPSQILGTRTAQCADNRRPWLGRASRA